MHHTSMEIILGQLRQVIASLSIEQVWYLIELFIHKLICSTLNILQINKDRDEFVRLVARHCDEELNKIGLVLLNVNITNITDDRLLNKHTRLQRSDRGDGQTSGK